METPKNTPHYSKDESWLTLMHEEDTATINHVYAQLRQRFKAFLMSKFMCSSHDALDIYPEAFSVLYMKIKDEKIVAPLQASLQTIINSIGWRLYAKRHFNKYSQTFENWDEWPEIQQHAEVETYFDGESKAQLVRKLLKKLNERQRQVLTLTYFEKYSSQSIMHALDFNSEGAVRKCKHDALKKLGQWVKESQVHLQFQ